MNLHNTGPSPALDTRYTIDVVVADTIPRGPVNKPIDETTRSRVTLAHDAKVNVYIRSDDIFTAEQERDVMNGTKRIYVFGEIDYRDIFGRQHQTTYCFFSRSDGKTIGEALNYCPTGNTAN